MQLSALQGSVLEHRIFEDDWQVDSISTAKLCQIGGAIHELPLLDKTNIDAVLPTLDLVENIKEDITNVVNQGLVVRIPDSAITYKDWTGIGYTKENPATGEAGYMLSGMLAGGMKAALLAGDMEKGLSYIIRSAQSRYREAFQVIIEELPHIVSAMQPIELIHLVENAAKYRINRVHDVDGQQRTFSYYIYFTKDAIGNWKIDRF